MTKLPKEFFVWSFNDWDNWGGYARPTNLHPLDDKERETGVLCVPRAESDAIVAAALKRALDACMGEYLEDPQTDDDETYQQAVTDCCVAVQSLTPVAAEAAFEQAVQEAERRGQIKAGGIFSDTNPEAQYVADGKNACPCCLGSGHKDDGDPNLARIVREAVEAERERCAKIAETVPYTRDAMICACGEGLGSDIAAAIRAPQEPSE